MARGSLKYQVEGALQSLNRIGRNKHNASSVKKRTFIYHGTTMHGYMKKCCTFTKWCKEKYQIQYLKQINPEMCRDYIQTLISEGKSPYTIASICSALRKLEKGIKRKFHCSVHIVPADLKIPRRSLKLRRGRGAYTDTQVQTILKNARTINKIAADALEIQCFFGLRISEVLNLRVTDIHFMRQVLVVWRGKGGRMREVKMESPESAEKLKMLCVNKTEMDLLFTDLDINKMEVIMKKACILAGVEHHKTHNLRHSYGVKLYVKRLEDGKTDTEARLELSSNFGHNRLDVTYSYVPRR